MPYFALGTRGISDLSRATLFGVLAALAGLVNPPLLSFSVVYWVSLWREHSWVRLAKLGAVSTSVAGICFSVGYLLASGLVSRTGAGYRPLTLSTAFSDQAVTAFGSGLTHLDTFGSWANVGDPALIGTVLLSFVFYSVITPAHSLANHLTQADAWGYFSSLSGLVSVVTYGALLLGAVLASAPANRGRDEGRPRPGLAVQLQAIEVVPPIEVVGAVRLIGQLLGVLLDEHGQPRVSVATPIAASHSAFK